MSELSVDDVRNLSGADSALIADAKIQDLIDMVEDETTKWINTSFTPKRKIDVMDGNAQSYIFARKNPLLRVRVLTSDDTSVDVSTIHVYKESGKISFGTSSELSTFIAKRQSVIMDYLYGLMEESSTQTTLSTASTAGTSVALDVASESGFTANDWVEIYGTDGKREVAQVESTAASTITVDELVFGHAVGSLIVLLQTPEYIKSFMRYEAAIAVAIYATGNTYTFNASYSIGELSVVKGVPFTHWRESFSQLVKERNFRAGFIKIRPAMAVK